ncbi:MAG: type II toxin-antitoxin system Phd/YefM family antitoxin [Candidatus Binatia bacterium]
MLEVSIDEVQTHLSRLLKQVALGEEIIIAESGKPVARLVPYETLQRNRAPGPDAGLVEIAEDFDAPLPEEILQSFEP